MTAHALYIPSVGDELCLAQDWTFTLWFEFRNTKFWNSHAEKNGLPAWSGVNYNGHRAETKEVTLPAGTILKVARVYIKAASWGGLYDSLTFSIDKKRNKQLGFGGRFWAKLVDVNTIQFEV